jgi:hypothetical protein
MQVSQQGNREKELIDEEVCSLQGRLSSPVDVVFYVWKLEAIDTKNKSTIKQTARIIVSQNLASQTTS